MKKPFLIFLFVILFIKFSAAQITSPAPYCSADFDDAQGPSVADAINSVWFSYGFHDSTGSQCSFPHYIYYNNLPPSDYVQGFLYTETVCFNVQGAAGFGMWMDFNHNNIFESTEEVMGTDAFNPLPISSNICFVDIVSIPSTALPGITRLRVRIVQDSNYTQGINGYHIMPCNAGTSATDIMDYGETEDYNINIIASSGINEPTENTISISPNPATNELTVNTNNNEQSTIIIYDLLSRKVLEQTYTNTVTLNIEYLSKGMYVYEVRNKKGSVKGKVVKQ